MWDEELGERAQQQQLGIIVCGGAVDTREREWQDIATSFNFYSTQSQMTVRLSIKSISSLNFFGDNTEVRVPRGSFRLCCDARCEVSSVFPKPKRECILILISLISL